MTPLHTVQKSSLLNIRQCHKTQVIQLLQFKREGMKIMGLIQALPAIRIISFRLIPQIFVLLRSFHFYQCVFAQPQNRLHRQCMPPPDDPNDFKRGKMYSHLNDVY